MPTRNSQVAAGQAARCYFRVQLESDSLDLGDGLRRRSEEGRTLQYMIYLDQARGTWQVSYICMMMIVWPGARTCANTSDESNCQLSLLVFTVDCFRVA